MTTEELEAKENEIQKEIESLAEKHNLTTYATPIKDGLYSAEKYLSAPLRLMWILKEPYDEIDENGNPCGGGWSIPTVLFKDPKYDYYTKGKLSAKMVTRISYCLLNGKKYAESLDSNNESKIVDSLQNIAYININKMPAATTTYNASLWEKYKIWKEILLKQIETYSPDVIIFGSTFNYFISDLFGETFPEPDFKFGMAKGFLLNNSLLIEAYHPGLFKNESKQDNYASEILRIVNTWKIQKNDFKNNSLSKENTVDYREVCITDCLKEIEKQLQDKFSNVERIGNGGDDIYWGRWADKETTPETIANWLLCRKRKGNIGYKINLDNSFSAELFINGDANCFRVNIYPVSKNIKELIKIKYDVIKTKFGSIDWEIPDRDKVDEGSWILGGWYGGEYNGANIWFDFRNASLDEIEYKQVYQKFKKNAIQGMISGRDDSIIKTVEELKKLLVLK